MKTNILRAAVAALALSIIPVAANAQGHEPDRKAHRTETPAPDRGRHDAAPGCVDKGAPQGHQACEPCPGPRPHVRPVAPPPARVVEPEPAPAPAPARGVIRVALPGGVTISVG